MTTRVITWQDDRGNKIDMCERCQTDYEARGTWPRNPATGCEYCSVAHGLHVGECELCDTPNLKG